MSDNIHSVPFFTDDILIGAVISASDPYYFRLTGHRLRDFIRENRCSLSQYDDRHNRYYAELDNGDFIEFYEDRF